MPHDDFQMEPVEGLPERPPEGENILWQGRPDWLALTREALNLNWILGYFLLLALWRGISVVDQVGVMGAVQAASPFLILGAVVGLILAVMGYVMARATVYTITNRRLAMRIGAALTVTLNLPYQWIGSADLKLRKNGSGTIVMSLLGETRLSYLVCWPHVRPWKMAPTQPALRCIPDAEKVARLLAEHATTRVAEVKAQTPQVSPVPAE